MRVYKHGIPGIGVTGKRGKNGKTGASFYIGPVDYFFEYIGGNVLTDSSIDYDDIDYDITYAEDEERLSHLYNEGDILYITDPSTMDVLYMIEITEDMTTCTKEYFLEHIKHSKPFTKKLGPSETQLMFPINVVNTGDLYMYNMCRKHLHGLFRGIYKDSTNSGVTMQDASQGSVIENTFEHVPSRFKPSVYTRKDVINNGSAIHEYTEFGNETTVNLMKCKIADVEFNINATQNTNLEITTNGPTTVHNLYIDNLYIKDGNFGNIESYNTLYSPELILDADGNCYTLTENEYDSTLETFIVDTSSFFRDRSHTHDNYHFGTIHKYWNYNELAGNTLDTNYYKPNYITGCITEQTLTNVTKIKRTKEGDFVRDWENIEYKNINDIYVRQALIYALDTSTLKDVSNLLNKSVTNNTYMTYQNAKGIIVTEQIPVYRTYDFIELLDGNQYRIYREIATDSALNGNGLYDKSGLLISEEPIETFIDASFYSKIDFTIDSSITKINLSILDPTALVYRHHEIVLWVSTPNGLKYYSKQTRADYNNLSNTFDISVNWLSNTINNNPGFINPATIGNNDLFTLTFSGDSVIVNASTNGDDDIVKIIELYENTNLIGVSEVPIDGLCTFNGITDFHATIIDNANLEALYNGVDLNVAPNHVLYTVKYAVGDEEECTHITTYDKAIGGYSEYRKFPKISLHMYNDMESLEQLNKAENGILVNQFQTFVYLKIDDFNQDTWGMMLKEYPDPKLSFTIIPDISVYMPAENKIDSELDDDYIISYKLIKPGVDVFNATAKELTDMNNIKEPISPDTYTYSFDLEEASAGIYKFMILIETINPKHPAYGIGSVKIKVNSIVVEYDGSETDESLKDINAEIKSEQIKFVIAPISYIAGYLQNSDVITNLGKSKWYGSDKLVNIVLKPFGLDTVQGVLFSKSRTINWNALKFKRRYLQDNIQTMLVRTLNINKIKELLPESLYNTNTLASDNDDIYETYLLFVYDSELFNPHNMHDEYQFQYNNNSYLASEYGQLANNTAVFVKQENEIKLRSLTLLNSMKVWNNVYALGTYAENINTNFINTSQIKVYKKLKYESDNPYKGHLETYGNGYQYLPINIDNEQYLSDGVMSLADIKNINNEVFMNINTYFEYDCNRPEKDDDYIPSKLYRSLLYDLRWVYPKYYSESGINLINLLPLSEASVTGSEPDDSVMPYNLCYTIYPRIMFNDEELTNIILMLRKPTVVDETKDSLDISDSCLPNVTSISMLSNPINVMN